MSPALASFVQHAGIKLVGGLVTIQTLNDAARRAGGSLLAMPGWISSPPPAIQQPEGVIVEPPASSTEAQAGVADASPANQPDAQATCAAMMDATLPRGSPGSDDGTVAATALRAPEPSNQGSLEIDTATTETGSQDSGIRVFPAGLDFNGRLGASIDIEAAKVSEPSELGSLPEATCSPLHGPAATVADPDLGDKALDGKASRLHRPPGLNGFMPGFGLNDTAARSKRTEPTPKETGTPKKRKHRSRTWRPQPGPVKLSESEERIAWLRLVGLGPRSSEHHGRARLFEKAFRGLWSGGDERNGLAGEIERAARRQQLLFSRRHLLSLSSVPTRGLCSLVRRELADRCASILDAAEEDSWAPADSGARTGLAQALLFILASLDPAVVYLHRSRLDKVMADAGVARDEELSSDERAGEAAAQELSGAAVGSRRTEGISGLIDADDAAGAGVTAGPATVRRDTEIEEQAREFGWGCSARSDVTSLAGADRLACMPVDPGLRAHAPTDVTTAVEGAPTERTRPENPELHSAARTRENSRELATVPEVAELAGRSRKTIYEWLKDPDSPLKEQVQLVGNKTRFRRPGLREAIAREKAMRQPRSSSRSHFQWW